MPFPADFHFIVHMFMAIHILWWTPLISWLLKNTEFCVQSTTQEWSSVDLVNSYRFLYDAVIVGILTYIVEVILSHLLEQQDILLLAAAAAAESNKGRGFITFFQFTVVDNNDIVNDIVNGFS
jgi:hypothetical protein